MDAVDEILAALNKADDESEEEPEVVEDKSGDKAGNKVIREMRAAMKKQADELKELREFKTTTVETTRTNTAKEVFKKLELPEEQAALFLKNHEGDVTADAIKQFVVDYKLPAKSEEIEGTRSSESKSEGFEAGGSNDATAQGRQKITRKALDELMYTDPVQAGKLVDAGLVDYSAK